MKTAGIVLAVCSLVIGSACYCAEKPDAGSVQPDLRQVQQTDYDKVIVEIKDELTKEQRDALEATHYCLEIAALIDQDIYPGRKLDKFELERQFRKIASEAYNYGNFQDGTIKLLEAVIERIKDLRISEGDRKLLDELYVQEKRSVWMRVLPQNMAVLISAEWKQLVANAVQTMVYSTFNYLKLRNEIETKYRKDSWELDKKDIEYDTEFIKSKLNVLYDICRNNKVEHVEPGDIVSLLKQFNEKEAVINNVLTDDDVWKPFNDCRVSYRTRDNEKRYKMYSTYWYQRGYLAWIAYKKNKFEEDRKEAMGCFKVYQELTNHQIVKYNAVAIDVAMMQIDLQPGGEKTDRDFLFGQLRIIRNNLSPRSLDYQSVRFFCGQIYYSALKDYDNAAEMFKESEVAGNTMRTKEIDEFRKNLSDKTEEITGLDKASIGDFAAKDGDKNLHFLPKLDAEFLARMAYYKSLIEAGKDIDAGNLNLVDKIYKDASWPYISPWEFLFYAAYVKEPSTKEQYYKEILPKVLKCENFNCNDYFEKNPDWKSYPVGKHRLPYDLKYLSYTYNRWGKDSFYLELPYQYALLSGIKFSMELLCNGEVVTSVPCNSETMEKGKENSISLRLEFPLNEKELIKKKIDGIRFDFEHKYFKSAITFDFGGGLKEGKDSNWYKNLPGCITFELSGIDELEKGTPADVGARR